MNNMFKFIEIFERYKRRVAILILIILFTIIIPYISKSEEIPDYDRSQFKHWTDPDHNGFNSRNDQLNLKFVTQDGWICPYTGILIINSWELDIDHIVPLSYAWKHGAYKWHKDLREIFANDPENLLPVKAAVNRSKSDKGPELWLPPNITYISDYIDKFNKVCIKYNLSCPIEEYNVIKDKYSKMSKGFNPSLYE